MNSFTVLKYSLCFSNSSKYWSFNWSLLILFSCFFFSICWKHLKSAEWWKALWQRLLAISNRWLSLTFPWVSFLHVTFEVGLFIYTYDITCRLYNLLHVFITINNFTVNRLVFLNRDYFVPGRHLAMPVSTVLSTGYSHTKNYLAHNVNCVEVEKPRCILYNKTAYCLFI